MSWARSWCLQLNKLSVCSRRRNILHCKPGKGGVGHTRMFLFGALLCMGSCRCVHFLQNALVCFFMVFFIVLFAATIPTTIPQPHYALGEL